MQTLTILSGSKLLVQLRKYWYSQVIYNRKKQLIHILLLYQSVITGKIAIHATPSTVDREASRACHGQRHSPRTQSRLLWSGRPSVRFREPRRKVQDPERGGLGVTAEGAGVPCWIRRSGGFINFCGIQVNHRMRESNGFFFFILRVLMDISFSLPFFFFSFCVCNGHWGFGPSCWTFCRLFFCMGCLFLPLLGTHISV